MAKAELVFFPLPAMGHITPMVELAKRLTQRDSRISITIFIFNLPYLQNKSYINSLEAHPDVANKRINFLKLPALEQPLTTTGPAAGLEMVKHYKPVVKQFVQEQVVGSDTDSRLAGIVLDFFCTPIMDVAAEINVPAYIFYASSSALLALGLHFQHMRDDHGVDVRQVAEPDGELDVPGFKIPIPLKVLPGRVLEKDGVNDLVLNHSRRYRSAKGILVNSFEEVESCNLQSLSEDTTVPTVYTVGPIIKMEALTSGAVSREEDPIMKWLDEQQTASVVFLCFGSMGSFGEDQVKEIAKGIEASGHPFLWSLRQPAKQEAKFRIAADYEDPADVLPEGFLNRTANRGRVIGWAPQLGVLSHPAVGGFVSHCGWNSILESLWFGVPVATWPMYAEQQTNAFRLVKELELAVEIRMDYRSDPQWKMTNGLVQAEVIKAGIRKLMGAESKEIRSEVKEMSKACRNATKEGGSSYTCLSRFIEDVFRGI